MNLTTNKNIKKSYMPKLSSYRKKKVLEFLNLKKSPPRSEWSKSHKTKDDWFISQQQKRLDARDKKRVEKKKQQQQQRRNRYSTTISFNVQVKKKNKYVETRVKQPVVLTYKQTKNMKQVYEDTETDYLAQTEYATKIVKSAGGHSPFVVTKNQPKNILMNTGMKQVVCERESIRRFNGADISIFDKGNYECVIDYLVYTFNNRIKSVTRENIINLLAYDADIPPSEFDIKKGITATQILLINKTYIRRNVIGVNFDNSVFIKHREEHLNKEVNKDIVFMMADNHFYPIEDKSVRKKLHIQTQISSGLTVKTEKVDDMIFEVKQNIINPSIDELLKLTNKNVFYTDRDTLTPILTEIMKRENTLLDECLYADKTGLKKIEWKYKKLTIYSNEHYQDVVYNCKQLKVIFNNQNPTKLVNKYFDDNYKFNKSCFNDEVNHIFNSNHTKTIAFRDTFSDDRRDAKTADVNKQYTSSLYFNQYEFCIVTPFDEVEMYDNKGIERTGFYEVETNNYFPLTGNGFYHYGTLIEVQKLDVKFKVKKQILCSQTLPHDYFKKFVDTIKGKCKNWKLMMNSFIGCLNKVQSENYKYLFSSDLEQVASLHFQSDCSVHISKHEYITENDKLEKKRNF